MLSASQSRPLCHYLAGPHHCELPPRWCPFLSALPVSPSLLGPGATSILLPPTSDLPKTQIGLFSLTAFWVQSKFLCTQCLIPPCLCSVPTVSLQALTLSGFYNSDSSSTTSTSLTLWVQARVWDTHLLPASTSRLTGTDLAESHLPV